MAKSALAFYRELLHKLKREQGREDTEELETAPEKTQKNLAFKMDLDAFCRMRDKGYAYDDIVDAIRKQSPVNEIFKKNAVDEKTKKVDSNMLGKALNVYIDNIGDAVNRDRLRISSNVYSIAEQAYKLRRDALLRKYSDMDESVYGAYQDGSIGIALIMKDGFSPEVVESVIKNNSPAPEMKNDRELYLATVMDGIKEVSSRYETIRNYTDADGENKVKDAANQNERNLLGARFMYCRVAQKYMQDTNTVILTGKDDENILYNLVDATAQVNLSLSEEQRQKISAKDMTRFTLPTLRRCIMEGSPVAIEPGRDTAKYTQDILAGFKADYQNRDLKKRDAYPAVLQRYKSLQDGLVREKEEIEDFLRPENMDAVIAKKLLEEHMPSADILRVLADQYQNRFGKTVPTNRLEDYAKDTLSRASNSLQAEHAIRYFNKKIPKDKTLEELRDMNISMTDVYQSVLAQRIKETPSFALRLSDEMTDRDAAERILQAYKDEDSTDLESSIKEAISAASPRYKLMETADEYPDRVVSHVREDYALLDNKKLDEQKIENDFIRDRGFASEGTQIQGRSPISNVFDRVKDGKAAVKMLMDKRNIEDIKLVIKSLALAGTIATVTAGFDLDHYVDEILHSAQEVYRRQQAIADWKAKDMDAAQRSAADVYLEKMHDIYNQKEFVQPSMDVRVMEDMLLRSEYEPDTIKEVIDNYSPIRAEACRDKHYVDYVEKEANASILVEEDKLKNWQVIPRTEPEATCEDEYDYQRKRMQDNIRLPFRSEMDVKICGTLIKEGFPMDSCARAISYRSPISQDKEEKNAAATYGKSILALWREQARQQEQQLAQQQLLTRVRVRDRGEDTSAGDLLKKAMVGAAAAAGLAGKGTADV